MARNLSPDLSPANPTDRIDPSIDPAQPPGLTRPVLGDDNKQFFPTGIRVPVEGLDGGNSSVSIVAYRNPRGEGTEYSAVLGENQLPIEILRTPGNVTPSSSDLEEAVKLALAGRVSKLEAEANRIANETPTAAEFKKAYEASTGKPAPPSALQMLESFKQDPLKFLSDVGPKALKQVLDISTLTLKYGDQSIAFNPSQGVAVEAAIAATKASKSTVLNTLNNLTWAVTAREQLAISKDQLAVSKRIADINQKGRNIQGKSLTLQEAATAIAKENLELSYRNDARSNIALSLQATSVEIQKMALQTQGQIFSENLRFNYEVLANRKEQLRIQEQGINTSATNAAKAYDQTERLALAAVARGNLNEGQKREFALAQMDYQAYTGAKNDWNTETRKAYANDPQKIRYDQDGWVLPGPLSPRDALIMTVKERVALLNDAKNATPRPNFIALEQKFKAENASLGQQKPKPPAMQAPSEIINSPEATPPKPVNPSRPNPRQSKPPSRSDQSTEISGNAYFSGDDIKRHKEALNKPRHRVVAAM